MIDETSRYAVYTPFWALMGHLTPSFWDIMLRGSVGVRGMSDRVSFMLNQWLKGSQWEQTGKILAVDFFHSHGLITDIIE